MSISIGRLGYLGLGLETVPGTPNTTPDIFLQYTDVSLRGHHEPIEVIASKASRLMDKNSVVGKKWSEGDVSIIADVVASGYLWKMALGEELYAAGTPSNHTFYTTTSGNTLKAATMIFGQDTAVEQYSYCTMDELSFEVSDGLATLTASVMGQFPINSAAKTFTSTSGTYLSFKDMSVKFGSDLTAANSASATPINEFSLTIANNLEVIHRSGSAEVSSIRSKGVRVSGSYTLFFESETDRNAYYSLNKRAMQVSLTGNANEAMRIRIPRFRLSEGEISTGLDDFFVINCEFVAEDHVDSGVRLIDVLLQNNKASTY